MRPNVSQIVFLILLSALAYAQSNAPGAITGKLIDVNGALITGVDASIHMVNAETKADYKAVVPANGEYSVTGLPPGIYDLHIPIACCMYRTYDQKRVTIKAGETLKLDLHLDWGINLGTVGDDPGMLGNDMRARAKNIDGPAPRLPDGTPDLSGMWYVIPDPTRQLAIPQLQPWAADMLRKLRAIPGLDQNAGSYCLPQHATPIFLPFPHKFIQTPTEIIHLTEFTTPGYRQIFMDKRAHPPTEWNPAWMGHSVGHWEGDTLVVDTVGFNDFSPGYGVHSEKLHVIERYRRPDKAHLEVEITAEDPEAFAGIFKTNLKAGLTPDEEILEFVCPENNKDPLHFGGLGWKGRP